MRNRSKYTLSKTNGILYQVVGPWRWSVLLLRVTLWAGSTAAGLHASHPHATLVQYIAVDGIACDLHAAEATSAPAPRTSQPTQAQTKTAGLHEKTVRTLECTSYKNQSNFSTVSHQHQKKNWKTSMMTALFAGKDCAPQGSCLALIFSTRKLNGKFFSAVNYMMCLKQLVPAVLARAGPFLPHMQTDPLHWRNQPLWQRCWLFRRRWPTWQHFWRFSWEYERSRHSWDRSTWAAAANEQQCTSLPLWW